MVPPHNIKKIKTSESPTPTQSPVCVKQLVRPSHDHTRTNQNPATPPIGSSKSAFTKIERNTKTTDLEKKLLFNSKKRDLEEKNNPAPKKQKLNQLSGMK